MRIFMMSQMKGLVISFRMTHRLAQKNEWLNFEWLSTEMQVNTLDAEKLEKLGTANQNLRVRGTSRWLQTRSS